MRLTFPFLTIFFFLSACGSILDNPESYDYTIEQKKICYCDNATQWMKLYISSDKVIKAINISTKKKLPKEQSQYYKTIDGLFELISETDTTTNILKVELDPKNNYPAYVYVNPKPEIIDDTTVVMVADADIAFLSRNYQLGN